jgi:hypothetical protein
MENKGEPPSSGCSALTPLLIGKNKRGNWVVQDQDGLCGGLFRCASSKLTAAAWFGSLLLNAFVRRPNRRQCIRIVKCNRSRSSLKSTRAGRLRPHSLLLLRLQTNSGARFRLRQGVLPNRSC